MLPKVINLGPLTIHLYGLIIATAIFLGWLLAKKRAYLYKIPQALFDDPVLIIPLFLAIVGARVYHVLDLWSYYSTNPIQILAIQNGGLGIWGGLIGVFVGFWLVAKVKKLSFFSILDLVSPSLLLGQAIGRFGNFINQEAFGPPTSAPWGIFIGPENRPPQFTNATHFHPTFFYEAALDFIFFALLVQLSHLSFSHPPHLSFPRKRESRFSIKSRMTKPGGIFALYLIFYSTSRFIVEFWRIDTWVIGSVKVAHALSITVFLIGILLFLKTKEWKHS